MAIDRDRSAHEVELLICKRKWFKAIERGLNVCRRRRLKGDNLTSLPEPNSLSCSTPTDRGLDAGGRRRDLDDDRSDKDEDLGGERGGSHQQNDNSSTVLRMP